MYIYSMTLKSPRLQGKAEINQDHRTDYDIGDQRQIRFNEHSREYPNVMMLNIL